MSLLGFAKKLNITLTWKFHEQEQNILPFVLLSLNMCLSKIALVFQCNI